MNIRNFAIIAHIDHGKSTLADRLMQLCGAVTDREMQEQMLDTLQVERQRGITVKSQTVRLHYIYKGEDYVLNLIDTPGHVDFSYEVKRALAACDGVLILVDATQGVEAQTIANMYRAVEENLFMLPVINKIDLESAQVDSVKEQIRDLLGITQEPVLISAKTGFGIKELLDAIVEYIPAPKIAEACGADADKENFDAENNPFLKALLIDSWFDPYLGVVLLVNLKQGTLRVGDSFKLLANDARHRVDRMYYLTPKLVPTKILQTGDVGTVISNMRNIKDCSVGDTLASLDYRGPKLRSFDPQKAVVFCGLFPPDSSLFGEMKDAILKLGLNDASLTLEPTHSPALGVGIRCGFLGLLHLEVITQRLEQEFDISVIVTAPTVEYKVECTNKEVVYVHDATFMPDTQKIKAVYEPWVKVVIFSKEEYLGDIIKLCLSRRAKNQDIRYINSIGHVQNITCTYSMPLSEIIFDFHDSLKSLSQGYASFDYEPIGSELTDVVIVNIMVNGTIVDGLSTIIFRDNAVSHGRWICEKLKDEIPRQLFVIAIQAAINGKIIARETVSALRKDVIAKCYGGDVSRKRKLLDKQKEGKKKMKEYSVGNVTIPNSAILKVLRKT